MGRRKKLNIDISNIESLQELAQEIYHDACGQIKDAQNTINNLVAAAEPVDVDDHTKIAKAKTDALKIKDSAIKIKLDVGKLQNEIIKKQGEIPDGLIGAVKEEGDTSLATFSKVREMMKQVNQKNG